MIRPLVIEYTSAQKLNNLIATIKEKIATICTSLEEIQNNYKLDLGPGTHLVPDEANITQFDKAIEDYVKLL